jgi:hypothetical protein
VSAAFEKLATSASELNAVSDEFAKPIHSIDATLQKLNLGVSAWVEVADHADEETLRFWDRSIGYGKVVRTWGLAIRSRAGFFDDPDEIREEVWLFNEAPRAYRLESLEKLPELLEKLAETASKAAAELKSKISLTKQVATTISKMASATPPAESRPPWRSRPFGW